MLTSNNNDEEIFNLIKIDSSVYPRMYIIFAEVIFYYFDGEINKANDVKTLGSFGNESYGTLRSLRSSLNFYRIQHDLFCVRMN